MGFRAIQGDGFAAEAASALAAYEAERTGMMATSNGEMHGARIFARARRLASAAATAMLACILIASAAAAADWRPEEWEDGTTLALATVGPDYNEHWSTVWYVVIDGEIYVRLGASTADQIEENIKRPYVQVKIAGKSFQDIRADPVEGMSATVDQAMADKYPMDFLFRFLPHPMIVRLRAASFP